MPALFASVDPTDSLDAVLHGMGDAVCVTDKNMVFVAANLAFAKFYGLNDPAELLGKTPMEVYPDFKTSVFYEACENTARTGRLNTRMGFSHVLQAWLGMRSSQIGENRFAMVVYRVSEETNRSGYAGEHDPLTSLPNRSRFNDDEVTLANYPQRAELWLFDISHFKGLNERLGFHAGDQCLAEVAARLKRLVGTHGRTYRMGDDRFLVVCTTAEAADNAPTVHQALDVLQQPMTLGDSSYVLQFHVGVAERAPADPMMLALSHAESAMAFGKLHKRTVTVYRPELDNQSYNPAMTKAIRDGLAAGHFELHFQPQVDILDGRVLGAEALVRWRHPERGLVSPAEFLPFAEDTGLIAELDREVVRLGFDAAVDWRDRGWNLHLSINLSAQSLCLDDTVGMFQHHLDRTGIEPQRLTVEITETALMHDPTMGQKVVARLREMGFQLAIDDFGSGYSSMAYLVRYPAHFLKIDRSFIQPIVHDSAHQTMVRNVIGLAHGLGIGVVAEGVETAEQLAWLRTWKCDMAQGYHIARPLDAGAFRAWIEKKETGAFASEIQ